MEPSREIDVKIAEKIMGWTNIKVINVPHRGPIYEGKSPDVTHKSHLAFDDLETVPHYTSNFTDAWQITESFKGFGFKIVWSNGDDEFQSGWALICGTRVIIQGMQTAELAISIGALRFLGIECDF